MGAPSMTFRHAGPFAVVLKRRVAAALKRPSTFDRRRRLHMKSVVMLAWFLASYVWLVFVASVWWEVVLLMGSLVFAMAGLAFNVLHDGGHGAYSRRPFVNRIMAMALDLLGGSSFTWKWKHNVLHHTYPNVLGVDSDVDLWPYGRVSSGQPRYGIHRFQHWYMWVLYGFVPVNWYISDFRFLVSGRIRERRFPRPRRTDLVVFISWKIVFVAWAILVPLRYHAPAQVLAVWLVCSFALGLALAIPFQLAHCVLEVQAVAPPTVERLEWAVHQVRTTANFATSNRLLTWYLGGLNFQIEHHLFPSVSHIHYPHLSPIVRAVCDEFHVRYVAHDTIGAAIRSHCRWLRRLGRIPQES